jgi:hypothetical protein
MPGIGHEKIFATQTLPARFGVHAQLPVPRSATASRPLSARRPTQSKGEENRRKKITPSVNGEEKHPEEYPVSNRRSQTTIISPLAHRDEQAGICCEGV